jgi:hypothetical protein
LLDRCQLELPGEHPSRQSHGSSSIRWVLSLNWLSQKWGQVHCEANFFGVECACQLGYVCRVLNLLDSPVEKRVETNGALVDDCMVR